MITINKAKFAESESEFVDSLFKSDTTCNGYAKRTKRSVKLYDHNKDLIGVVNKWGCILKATKIDTNKTWYSYGDVPGIGEISCLEVNNAVGSMAIDSMNKTGEREYFFK